MSDPISRTAGWLAPPVPAAAQQWESHWSREGGTPPDLVLSLPATLEALAAACDERREQFAWARASLVDGAMILELWCQRPEQETPPPAGSVNLAAPPDA